ncbi:MAG: hypothetical protein CL933_17955 [Deltaproteobacteria bacterium]|nr:hypothetical protein [Deltaproteobacteria bacterium]
MMHSSSQRSPMARPLEFEREEALEAAMDLFWRQGFVSPPPKKEKAAPGREGDRIFEFLRDLR